MLANQTNVEQRSDDNQTAAQRADTTGAHLTVTVEGAGKPRHGDDEWCFVCQGGRFVPEDGCPGCSRGDAGGRQ